MGDDAPQPIQKRVDERWKDEVERERRQPPTGEPEGRTGAQSGAGHPARPGQPAPEHAPPASPSPDDAAPNQFSMFMSSLSMQAMIALGELPLPGTDQRHEDLEQARYLIDIIGMLQEKTRGNLAPDEAQFLEDALYELRVRYTQKVMPPPPQDFGGHGMPPAPRSSAGPPPGGRA